jgi:hypothetical protein
MATSSAPRRRAPLHAFLVIALIASGGGRAVARRGVRPLFEPTDLEMEDAGTVELDVQVGAIRSQGPARVVVPDFELDIGISSRLELDLDGAYAIEGPADGPFSFDHAAPDSLWPCAKLGLIDFGDDGRGTGGGGGLATAWALGLQAGPKLPVGAGAHGVGAEGLVLLGYSVGRTHLVLNTGGFVDPSPDATSGRPRGVEAGLDLARDLGSEGHFSFTGEVSGVRFLSADPNQISATAGLAWSPSDSFEVSLVGLWGFLAGGDRYGALLGLSPKLRLFK